MSRAPAASRPAGAPSATAKTSGQTARTAQRPTQGQLNSFLGKSAGSTSASGAAGRSAGRSAMPGTQSTSSGPQTKTFTTKGGSTVTVGAGKGGGTTAGGATVGAGGVGVKVEGPGGATYVGGKGAAGATKGGQSAVAAGGVSGAKGPGGNAAVNVRGGYANSAGVSAAGSATAARDRYGYTAVAARGGVAAGGVTRAGGAAAVRGPGGAVISAGRGGAFVNGQFVGGARWGAVNGAFAGWGCFRPGWYAQYPGAWLAAGIATTAWLTAGWGQAAAYGGCSGEPAYYDYGNNLGYGEDGNVYQDGEPVATAEEYYDQGNQIAALGAETANDDWLPLGVFGVVSEGQESAEKVVQLAVNKDGVVRGNLHDMLADTVVPVTGAVDVESQRVAVKIEGNNALVVETGLYNLTNDEVPVLLQFGPDHQETRTLIRLSPPETAEGQGS
jgi:hypothetical protein